MSESFIYSLILNQFSKWDTFYIFLWNSSELQARLRESQIHFILLLLLFKGIGFEM